MKMMIMLSMIMNWYMLTSSNPILIMTTIIIQTTFICLMTWMMFMSSWFSFLLFLIFLGGIMILFVYVTSLASNEKMNIIMENKNLLAMLLILMMTMSHTMNPNMAFSKNKEQMNILFSSSLDPTTLMMMTYLLLALIIVVKISKMIEGPLRSAK